MEKKRSVGKTIGIVILALLLILLVLVAGGLTWLTIREYKPADTEMLDVSGKASQTLSAGDSLRLMTWNVGYGALGDNADFFMEGGEMVTTADEARVKSNLKGMANGIYKVDPDVVFLQEVDKDSTRSYHIDETEFFLKALPGTTATYAPNFVAFVPYPIPPIGSVNGGLQTLTKLDISDAHRLQLPVPFKWPVRTANLKRCLSVNYVPIKGSDKELVLVNLHLEAYDDGEGKIAQTRMLQDLLKEEYKKGNYVIAAGDFNQSFSNVDLTNYPVYEGMWEVGLVNEEDFAPEFSLVTDNTYPTCRSLVTPYKGADKSTFQYYVIDGFIVSANLRVDNVETQNYDFINTDHDPVVLDVTLQ